MILISPKSCPITDIVSPVFRGICGILTFPLACLLASLLFPFPAAITSSALPQERHLQATEHVLAYLAKAEDKESDPWFRDDYRIAWITTLYASRGNPQPHVDATYLVLGLFRVFSLTYFHIMDILADDD